MSAVEVEIAEAIKDELNSNTWSMEFLAVRSEADPATPLTSLGEVRVDVVPWQPTTELESRGEILYTVPVDILVRKRFGAADQALDDSGEIDLYETDRLRNLAQEIREFWMPSQTTKHGRELTAVPNAAWDETRIMAAMVRPHFRQYRQFTAWVRVTYTLSKVAGT